MPKRDWRQLYSTNNIQATSAGRANQSQQTTRNGRFTGSTQTFTGENGKVGNRGQQVDRTRRNRETRVAFNDVGTAVQRMGGTYESLRARGLTDNEIQTIYGLSPNGGSGGGSRSRGLSWG